MHSFFRIQQKRSRKWCRSDKSSQWFLQQKSRICFLPSIWEADYGADLVPEVKNH